MDSRQANYIIDSRRSHGSLRRHTAGLDRMDGGKEQKGKSKGKKKGQGGIYNQKEKVNK